MYADITAGGQAIPRQLLAISRDDLTIDADPAHWRAVLYRDLIQAGDPDIPITYPECLRVLADHQINLTNGPAAAERAVTVFLESLVLRGLLRRPSDTPARPDPAGHQLLGDLTTVPDPSPQRGTGDRPARACIRCGELLALDVYGPHQDRHFRCDWERPTRAGTRRPNGLP